MREMRSSAWLQLVAFTGAGILAFAGLYGLVTLLGVSEPNPRQMSQRLFRNDTDVSPPRSPAAGQLEVWVLHRDRPVTIGRSRVTFRGLDEGGNLRIDAVLPELDPQRVYAHSIPREQARKGFRIANEGYRLKKIGRSAVVLYRTAPP